MKLIQISLVLKNFLYPNIAKKKSGLIMPGAKKDIAQTLDFKKLTFARKDNVISSMQWDLESCQFMWNALLKIFTGVNKIKNPVIQAEAMSGISNIIDIFLHAESKASFSQIIDRKNQLFLQRNFFNLNFFFIFQPKTLLLFLSYKSLECF